MYGAYYAACLHEFGRALGKAAPRVVVLESGPFVLSEHVENLTNVGFVRRLVEQPLAGPASQEVAKESAAGREKGGSIVPHARCVGGKSPFWGGWAPRMSQADLEGDGVWPREVIRDLFQAGVAASEADDGYPFIEQEIGVSERTDFLQGTMQDVLLARSRASVEKVGDPTGSGVALEAPEEAPIAVQAKPPLSGLFSFDKFSSLPRLLEAIREDGQAAQDDDRRRRLFLVPNFNVLRVLVDRGVATGVEVAEIDLPATGVPADRGAPRVARAIRTLRINPGGMIVLAGNAVNSTRLALNSFPRPSALGPELMGRNLMVHVRSNHVWQLKRSALGLPADELLGNTALHIPGRARKNPRLNRRGRFHFQFYASANVPPGGESGPTSAEEYLYRLMPNFDRVQEVMEAQDDRTVALAIRTCGETFGDRTTPVPTTANISWMDVAPPGVADELFVDRKGSVVARVPRAFVHLAETAEDAAVRADQTAAAFQFIAELAQAPIAETGSRVDYATFIASSRKVRYVTGPNAADQDGIGTTYHECGTLWMGDSPASSVTDVHGRIHHVANVACVDQALFPTSDSANPVPTGLALARRAARATVRRYGTAPKPIVEPGFRSLFNGTLNGWKVADANNFFLIDTPEGPVLGAGVEGDRVALGVLWHEEVFGDFELRLQYRVFSPLANSGIFLRAPKPVGNLLAPGGFYATALEVQIDERGFHPERNAYGSALHRTGAVYGRIPSTRWAARRPILRGRDENVWNDMTIAVSSGDIRVSINGEVVTAGQHVGPSKGHIGLQCHTEVVQFRALRVK
jgi:hypothetical protein